MAVVFYRVLLMFATCFYGVFIVVFGVPAEALLALKVRRFMENYGCRSA